MPAYSLQIVRDLSMAVKSALYDDELPRYIGTDGAIRQTDPGLVAMPGSVSVFINPIHRMLVLRGDEYRPDLCRKINESRYGPPYYNAPVMGSENSEDATTWSFFRTLERRCGHRWVARLLEDATGAVLPGSVDRVTARYWFGRVTDDKLPVPPGVNETPSEFDVLIEFYVRGQLHLIAIEAKVSSAFSGKDRDQFLRVIDVGSYYAATRFVPLDRFWTVAVLPATWTGAADKNPHDVVDRYKLNAEALRQPLEHRSRLSEGELGRVTNDELATLASHIGSVSWEQLIVIGRDTHDPALRARYGPWA